MFYGIFLELIGLISEVYFFSSSIETPYFLLFSMLLLVTNLVVYGIYANLDSFKL